MSTQTHWLFEVPLAHEAVHYGNQEVPGATGGVPPVSMVQPFVQMRSGRWVGNVRGAASNIREDVRNTLDRLHLLWSITNENYAREYPFVSAARAGSSIDPANIPRTLAALRLNEEPHLHRVVVGHFLNLALSNNVGRGQANNPSDVLKLQDILFALKQMNGTDHTREHAAVMAMRPAPITNPEVVIPATLNGIRRLKDAIAGGRLGWAAIHADEDEAGGDRFGGQTFDCGDLSVFVPRSARPDVNKVHVFFSPGLVTGDSGFNAALTHGLRGASDASEWILVSVRGEDPGFRTINTSQIVNCLTSIGRTADIQSLRLSAHSRGFRGLRETISRRLISTALVKRVVILDANYKSIADALRHSGIPASRVVAYGVTMGDLPLAGVHNIRLQADCKGAMRAIGYSRLIQDAMVTRPLLPIPSVIRSQLLTLPARGCFTTSTPTGGCQVNIIDFCRRNKGAIATILRQEEHSTAGLKRFVDDNDLIRLGVSFVAETYSHHLFVAEIAHEITD